MATSDITAVRLSATDLAASVEALFVAAGMSKPDAATLTETVIWAELRGQSGHGILRVPQYLRQIANNGLNAKAVPISYELVGGLYRVEALRAAGPIAMAQALEVGARLARSSGVSFGIVIGSSHTGAIGRYAELAASQGLLALIGTATGPVMALHGAKTRSMGTNPIAVGVPGSKGPAILLDMATSIVAYGQILAARRLGQSIPPGWAIDDEGEPTEDPNRASTVLPVGGAKGSGLALAIEMIAGLLGGGTNLLEALLGQSQPGTRGLQNTFVLLVDVSAFREPWTFAAEADELASLLRNLPKARGFEQILLPGDRGSAQRDKQMIKGIQLPVDLWQELEQAADKLNCRIATAELIQTP